MQKNNLAMADGQQNTELGHSLTPQLIIGSMSPVHSLLTSLVWCPNHQAIDVAGKLIGNYVAALARKGAK